MRVFREGSVAAVIPTCRRPEMVLAAIRSVLAQTVPVVEVIVVVDGPDPQTSKALADFCAEERDARIRVIELAEPVGGAEARNIGVRLARAAWIALLDDDDVWLPPKLAVQLARAELSLAPEPVIASSVLACSPRGGDVWPRQLYQPRESMAEYLFCRKGWRYGGALLQTSTLLAPRELLLRVPFDSSLKKHQDWDWLLRVSADPAVEIATAPEPLVIFHVEGNRSSVGRAPDWEFSLRWASERRSLFTPRAFSAFVATECAPQAGRSGATLEERAGLFRTMLRQGSPSLKMCLLCLVFLLVPQGFRRSLRNAWKLRMEHPALPESPLSS